MLNRQTLLQAKTEGIVTLAWAYSDTYFIVTLDGEIEEAKQLLATLSSDELI